MFPETSPLSGTNVLAVDCTLSFSQFKSSRNISLGFCRLAAALTLSQTLEAVPIPVHFHGLLTYSLMISHGGGGGGGDWEREREGGGREMEGKTDLLNFNYARIKV